MNRVAILFAPPLAFVLAAACAWLTGSPAGNETRMANSNPHGERRGDIAPPIKNDPATAIREFESALVLNAIPPKEIHDAEGMEIALDSDERNSSIPHGDMNALSYSIEWADEAPEQMFDWLIHQNGDSFKRVLFPTYLLFGKWPEKDMEAALAALSKISNPKVRQQALLSSLEILCKNNPGRAHELMVQNLGLFPPDGGSLIFASYATARTTCELLLSLPAGEERTHLLANLLRNMANSPGQEERSIAVSTWKNATEDTRREWVAAGFSSGKENAASFDGLEDLVRQKAEESGDPADAKAVISNQGTAWAKRDLPAALNWTQTRLKGEARVNHSAELFGDAASQDLDVTIATWRQLPASILKTRAAKNILRAAPEFRKSEVESLLNATTPVDP